MRQGSLLKVKVYGLFSLIWVSHKYFLVICLHEISQVYLSYIILMKSFVIFLLKLYVVLYRPYNRFYYLRKLFLVACISKRICCFPFLSAILKRQGSTISEMLKLSGSIYRIVKNQNISLTKFLLAKVFNLIYLSCC